MTDIRTRLDNMEGKIVILQQVILQQAERIQKLEQGIGTDDRDNIVDDNDLSNIDDVVAFLFMPRN